MTKRLLIIANPPEFFLSHRLPLALAARDAGWEVHVGTGPGEATREIREQGFQHWELPLSRSGTNPLHELKTLLAFHRVLRQVRPTVLHLVTIKPVLYGGIAARLNRAPGAVFAISGLGSAFVATGAKARLVRSVIKRLYRFALNQRQARVIFQNPDDRKTVSQIGAVSPENAVLIRGSGVNLEHYPSLPEPEGNRRVVFTARLLIDKGIREFLDAANTLVQRYYHVEFYVIGDPDPGNPSSVSEEELRRWRGTERIEFIGFRSDIAQQFARAHLVVLPSYREGLPKVLIEAAACGRAVVTTDVPGCRDAIIPDETGVLVPPRDAQALAGAIESLINDPERRQRMGRAGRALAEREFRIKQVVDRHLEIYEALLAGMKPAKTADSEASSS